MNEKYDLGVNEVNEWDQDESEDLDKSIKKDLAEYLKLYEKIPVAESDFYEIKPSLGQDRVEEVIIRSRLFFLARHGTKEEQKISKRILKEHYKLRRVNEINLNIE